MSKITIISKKNLEAKNYQEIVKIHNEVVGSDPSIRKRKTALIDEILRGYIKDSNPIPGQAIQVAYKPLTKQEMKEMEDKKTKKISKDRATTRAAAKTSKPAPEPKTETAKPEIVEPAPEPKTETAKPETAKPEPKKRPARKSPKTSKPAPEPKTETAKPEIVEPAPEPKTETASPEIVEPAPEPKTETASPEIVKLENQKDGVEVDFPKYNDSWILTCLPEDENGELNIIFINKGVVKMNKITVTQLRAAVKELNESGLYQVKKDKNLQPAKINPVCSTEDLIERFLEAVETIPEENEKEIPIKVVEIYNLLVSDKTAVEVAPKSAKSAKSAKTPKSSKVGSANLSTYTRLDSVFDALDSGKEFTTLEEIADGADVIYVEKTNKSSNASESKSAVKKIYWPLVRFEFFKGIGPVPETYTRADAIIDAVDVEGGCPVGELLVKAGEVLQKKTGKPFSAKETVRQIKILIPVFIRNKIFKEDNGFYKIDE